MRFLSVANRELRAAGRQKATYRTRWLTAAIFFALLVWLLWAFNGFRNRLAAPHVFEVYSILTFAYCLLIGTARTADCISSERRNGTLGLLFLTNLNSAEIIGGKLCSSALANVYGLMAIFPMLALPLLMGGTTFEHFARTVLGLLNGILFSLAAGFVASVMCVRQFTAVALAMGLAISLGGGLMLGAAAANSYGPTRGMGDLLAVFSPLYTVVAASGGRVFGTNHYWSSVATVACTSLAWFGLTTYLLARTWRDRAKSARALPRLKLWRRWEQSATAKRAALRRRLLNINPFFWLGGRKLVSAPVFMFITVVLAVLAVYVAGPFFGRVMRAGTYSSVIGQLFAWFWTGLTIHALVLYYAAMSASQRLAEDKQTGALELILSTPTSEQTISRGLWMAYGRKMFFPALVAVLVHLYFLWQCLIMATLEPPGLIPPGATTREIFWSALLNQPLRGYALDWQFGFMLRVVLLALVVLMSSWVALGWVGRWLGLRMKHPGFAPMASLALLATPPVLLFSLACYLADKYHLDRLPERHFLPLMMWLACGIGIVHCLLLSVWAASRMRQDLRSLVMSRYQPLATWRWRLPSRRTLWRLAAGTTAFAAAVFLFVVAYFGYQNRQSRKAWTAFQNTLKQSGESLDLWPLLPAPVPDNANFARSPVFLSLLSQTNAESVSLFARLKSMGLQANGSGNNSVMIGWSGQRQSRLQDYVNWIVQTSTPVAAVNRTNHALAILEGLRPHREMLREVAAAAARLPAFQISTNRNASAVLHPPQEEISALERLHLLFQARACALLALGQKAEAAKDLLTGLRLTRLARQIPDVRFSVRVQVLLARSLQPLWEGLREHAWNEAQLAAVQRELTDFNLLADYTNALHRVVLANIETWRVIPDNPDGYLGLPSWDDGSTHQSGRQLLPRLWWFDCCIQLYRAGQQAQAKVDVAAGRIQLAMNWSDLSGLPLDVQSTELFQQMAQWGANPGFVPFAQTSLNQAIIACALERIRLTNKVYPATLEALVPALLHTIPNDAVSGRPMIYQPLENGTYILRGVGPNGIDDRKNKSSDDWLWTYSTNTPTAKK
jgi:ABC-type transport system involved in multi-copper enzyme maturation permease subunit